MLINHKCTYKSYPCVVLNSVVKRWCRREYLRLVAYDRFNIDVVVEKLVTENTIMITLRTTVDTLVTATILRKVFTIESSKKVRVWSGVGYFDGYLCPILKR